MKSVFIRLVLLGPIYFSGIKTLAAQSLQCSQVMLAKSGTLEVQAPSLNPDLALQTTAPKALRNHKVAPQGPSLSEKEKTSHSKSKKNKDTDDSEKYTFKDFLSQVKTEKNFSNYIITPHLFELAKKNTKKKYVGLEPVIDQVFNQIESWCLFPETRKDPLVVVMTGMTGTGKTSLIRTILNELGLLKDYYYFDMAAYASEEKSSYRDIGEAISKTFIHKDESDPFKTPRIKKPQHPIFFLDEFQRISTRNPNDGKNINRPDAESIFELLGNSGQVKVGNPAFPYFQDMLSHPDLYLPVPRKIKYGSEEKFDTVKGKILDLAQERLSEEPLFSQLDISNSLIFIAMNLDSAYTGSRISNPDVISADELHHITSDISNSDIREGLMQIFRTEHVGRMGSRFVNFPSLSEKSYREYIKLSLKKIKKIAKDFFHMDVSYSQDFENRIYNEGVIPAQGIRPLLQTVNVFALDPLAQIYVRIKKMGLQEQQTSSPPQQRSKIKVKVTVEPLAKESTWSIYFENQLKDQATFLIPSDYLKSLKLRPEQFRTQVALRLASQIVISAFGERGLPYYVRANSRLNNSDGVISFEQPGESANFIKLQTFYVFEDAIVNQIAFNLAPYVIEKMIYGQASKASGDNLKIATQVAEKLVGTMGYAKNNFGKPELIHTEILEDRPYFYDDVAKVMDLALRRAEQWLIQESEFLAALANTLTRKVDLHNYEIIALFEQTFTDEKIRNKILNNETEVSEGDLFLSSPKTFQFKPLDSKSTNGEPKGFFRYLGFEEEKP